MGSRFFTAFTITLVSLFSFPSAHASEVETLLSKVREKKLWTHPQWVNLVHYHKDLFGGLTAQPDGEAFFLAKDGKTNPEAELLATLSAFFRKPTSEELTKPRDLTDAELAERLKKTQGSYSSTHGKKTDAEIQAAVDERKRAILGEQPKFHPLCQFPARLRFLKRELDWKGEGLPSIECYKLDEFRRRVDTQSASLVFSSFYLNNPSSTFGHSFIRLNSGLWSQYGNYRNELLDTGVNYAANATVTNPVLYAVFGMAGLFPGTFTAVPYYYKVREYNDFESRDLWSYDLALTKDELAMLVDHVWEEGTTYYDYFYFTENCSYHMFTLLDAAAPRFELANRLAFYVIPSDTIRVLYSVPGLVTKVSYRPSVLSQFRYRLKTLSDSEKNALDRLIDAKDPAVLDTTLSKESQASVLDAFSDQVELAAPKELLVDGSPSQILKQKILLRRSSIGVRSPALVVPAPTKSEPQSAHGMRRISLGYASEAGKGTSEVIGYKFAMHELLDPGVGFPRNMHVDFGQVRARYRNHADTVRQGIEFDEVNILKMTALTPVSRYYKAKSVRAEFGWKKTVDRDCRNPENRCFPLDMEFMPGMSFDPNGKESITLFGFIGPRLTFTPNYQGVKFRLGAGPRVGALIHFSDYLRFMIHTEVMARVWADEDITFSSEATLRYGFAKDFAVDVSAKRERDWSEGMAQLHYYY